jgi:hypothetical protein
MQGGIPMMDTAPWTPNSLAIVLTEHADGSTGITWFHRDSNQPPGPYQWDNNTIVIIAEKYLFCLPTHQASVSLLYLINAAYTSPYNCTTPKTTSYFFHTIFVTKITLIMMINSFNYMLTTSN